MSESPQQESAAAPRSRLVPLLLMLLLAAVLFGAVFMYVGGVDGVKSLLGLGTSDGADAVETTSTPAAALSPEDLAAAKLVYAEQIESQDNIDKLVDGDVKSFKVNSVDADVDAAVVRITVQFKDGTEAPGAMRFIRSGKTWYFTTISGLRQAETGGLADSIGSQDSIAPTLTADQKLAQVGVGKPDSDVLNTIAEQQALNQPVARDLIAGEYEWYTLGKPVEGPDTFTIPVEFGGSDESTISASIVVIAKNVEGRDRLFITTFKRD